MERKGFNVYIYIIFNYVYVNGYVHVTAVAAEGGGGARSSRAVPTDSWPSLGSLQDQCVLLTAEPSPKLQGK